jgi:hypothetical protein
MEHFYLVDEFMALHFMATGSSGREAHMKFADESACLTVDNFRNEGK